MGPRPAPAHLPSDVHARYHEGVEPSFAQSLSSTRAIVHFLLLIL